MEDKRKSCFRNASRHEEPSSPRCEYDCVGVEETDGEGVVLACEDYKAEPPGVICMDLNRFANLCGYFHNAYLTDGVTLNNGYNCRHPKQEECEEIGAKRVGACYSRSCPLGYTPDADDLVNFNIISEGDAKSDYPHGESCPDYIVVTDVETIGRLREIGENGLAVWPYRNDGGRNLTKYIELDAALRVIHMLKDPTRSHAQNELIRIAEVNLSKLPTADVAEVRTGHWIGEGDGYADGEIVYDVWYCSECNYCIDDGTDDPEKLPRYCQDCGARMDGAE